MKKTFLLILFVLIFSSLCEAKVYVVVDKSTGKVCGTADIADAALADWKSRYSVVEAGESFRGKQPYEIKYDGNKLSFEASEKVSEYLNSLKEIVEDNKKAEILKTLGITEEQLEWIKAQ